MPGWKAKLLGYSPLSTFWTIFVGLAFLVVLVFTIWFFIVRPHSLKEEAAQMKADSALATGYAESAKHGLEENMKQVGVENSIDQQVGEGNNAIRKNTGNSRAGNCAALRSMCMSKSYSDSQQCRTVQRSCP